MGYLSPMTSTILDTPKDIAHFMLATLKGSLYLESKGMKRRGVSARKQAAALGYTGNVGEQIAKIEAKLAANRAAMKAKAAQNILALA